VVTPNRPKRLEGRGFSQRPVGAPQRQLKPVNPNAPAPIARPTASSSRPNHPSGQTISAAGRSMGRVPKNPFPSAESGDDSALSEHEPDGSDDDFQPGSNGHEFLKNTQDSSSLRQVCPFP